MLEVRRAGETSEVPGETRLIATCAIADYRVLVADAYAVGKPIADCYIAVFKEIQGLRPQASSANKSARCGG